MLALVLVAYSVGESSVASGTVAVDIDNVIADTDPLIRGIIRSMCGVSLAREDIVQFAYSEALVAKGLDRREAKRVEDEALWVFHDKACAEATPVDGAIDALNALSNAGLSIVVVTCRLRSCEGLTRVWLRQAGVPYDKLLFVGEKAERCLEWAVLVEDAAHHALAVAERGVPICLLNHPWNRSLAPHPLILRADSWRQATGLILSLVGGGRDVGCRPSGGRHIGSDVGKAG